MANNLGSNVTRKLARVFLEKFRATIVLAKSVDTQLLAGKFTPESGDTTDFKRPHDYNTIRTSGGDISLSTKSNIVAGKATGTVQPYFTVATEWGNVEEALFLDQLDRILAPMATRMVTDLELDLGRFMLNNAGLSYGNPGTAITKWSDIAGAGALMRALGVPSDSQWHYVMNPFVQTKLADTQAGLNGNDKLIADAWRKAMITDDFAGMAVLASNALKSRTSAVAADRAGTIVGTPTATYVAHKDTMIQSVAVTAFQASATLKAGDIFEVTGKHYRSLATRDVVVDETGDQIKWRAVLTEDVVLGASGEGTLKLAGPAIFEANGQYNTIDAALGNGDVITLLGTSGAIYQPALFFHKQAFGLGTVKLPKLYSTDTVATTEEGFSIRVSRYADGDKNQQMVRFDMLPAFACFNPFFAGQGYGKT
jgi:hypothetical protein